MLLKTDLSYSEASSELIQRDLKHYWHPCSQMKDYEQFSPLMIKRARGCFIELQNGQKIIDAISSWWCKSLGHNHPRLKAALIKQLKSYEHIIPTNTCQTPIVLLAEKLAGFTQSLSRVFFANDGCYAVEIALKMSLHARVNQNDLKRNQFMSLENSYHGESALALAISDCDLYCKPYKSILPKFPLLKNIPYVNSVKDPLWQDCSAVWPALEKTLNKHAETLSAIIVEPIVQGGSGMKLYSKDFLVRLRQWTKKNNVHLIADEIMTGLGRTGYPLACMHANIEPDFICLSKGLTSGFLPMSAVLTTEEIYHIFYDDYESGKSFLHSHTLASNALAAAVALECLTVLEEEDIYARVRAQEAYLLQSMQEIAFETKCITNVRGIGGIVAADLILERYPPIKRLSFQIYQNAVKLGALLRPLGNTIYWLPPLNIQRKTLKKLQKITKLALVVKSGQ